MQLEERYRKIIEDLGWDIYFLADGKVIEIEQESPTGELLNYCLSIENIASDACELSKTFNTLEYVDMWSRTQGASSTTILKRNAITVARMLHDLAASLLEVDYDTRKENEK